MIESAEQTIVRLEAKIVEQSETIRKQDELIKELVSHVSSDKPDKKFDSADFVELNGKKYRLRFPKFEIDRKVKTIDDLKKDSQLLQYLIDIQSSNLVEI
jgi:hypothetical protein